MKKMRRVDFSLPLAWPLLLVCAIALLMMLAATQVPLIDQDETLYALIAIDLLDGKMPYQGVYDHKPVGIYYLYSTFFALFGEEFLSIRIMSILLLLGMAANLYFGLLYLEFGFVSRLAAVALSLSFPIGLDGLAGNTEIMQNFALSVIFHIACLVREPFSRRGSLLLGIYGFFVGVGFSFNYLFSFLALFGHLACLFYWFFLRKCSFTQLLKINFLVFLGFCLALLIIYLPYWVDYLKGGGLLQSYLRDQGEFLGGYRNDLNKRYIIDRVFVWILPFTFLLVPAFIRSKSDGDAYSFVKYLALAIFLAAIIASSMSLRFFNHYWVLAAVSLALFAALAFEKSEGKLMESWLVYSLSIPLMVYMLSGSEKIINHYTDNAEGMELRKSLSFIEENLTGNGKVVSLSASPAYIYLGKLEATNQKYLFPGQLASLEQKGHLDSDQRYLDLLMDDANFALVASDFCVNGDRHKNTGTCAYLGSHFSQIASFDGYHPVHIYRRVK